MAQVVILLGRDMNNQMKLAILALVVVIAAAFFMFRQEQSGEEVSGEAIAPTPVERVIAPEPELQRETDLRAATEQPAEPRVVEDPVIPPPEKLDGSDEQVLKAVDALSPKIAQWLVPEEQVRKWVLTVDLLAEGKLPLRHKPLEFPIPTFAVESLNADEFVSENANGRRVTLLIDTVTAIPPKTLARYYHAWLPTLNDAYGELGKKDDFEQRLAQAIDRIIATEDIEDDARLVQPHVFYEFEDKKLEKKSALEKALWRMGKDNRHKLQAYLKELKFYL